MTSAARRALWLGVLAATCLGGVLRAQRPTDAPCTHDRSGPTAAAWLDRARHAMGLESLGRRVVRESLVESTVQDFESDRTYPPFFESFDPRELWLDPASGVMRWNSRTTFVGAEYPGPTVLNDEAAAYAVRDTGLIPAPGVHRAALTVRPLDAWAEVHDWAASGDAAVSGRCVYRDYPRVVLQRTGPFGAERLFLDPKTALPVKVDRIEPHYLWGQVQVEYVYSTWVLDAGVAHPGSAFRMVDGHAEISRTISGFETLPPDSAPALAIPAAPAVMPSPLPVFLQALPTDTIRVGPDAFVLKNRGFGELVTLARDTVFVLDATQSEDRARADSVWIGKLFPGRHPVVLVVTDLAWPHISGVRFWVASGATVVSYHTSRAFLDQVLARRWTLAPDRFERLRSRVRLVFRPVRDSLRLAGGAVTAYPIDGIGSETALMVYLSGSRVLWGSDFVQDLSQPTLYALEVWRAARRAGLAPLTVVAEHLAPASWDTLRTMVGGLQLESP
jgi:hypothetical protein